MQDTQLKDLVMKLKKFQTVEVKSAKGGRPKFLYDTLSSFGSKQQRFMSR